MCPLLNKSVDPDDLISFDIDLHFLHIKDNEHLE